jgi:hypothetical protein
MLNRVVIMMISYGLESGIAGHADTISTIVVYTIVV